MAQELWRLSACELGEGIRAREWKCIDVMSSVVDRIRQHNGHLNAIVDDHSDSALIAAEQADRVVESGGPLGPLHGIPITIKENIDVEGQRTPNGLPALEGLIAPADSPVTRNFKDAGAIIVGRTNTPELSMRGTTDNPLHGRTFNPWNEEASPGGSSGGASSAAAAGFGPIHHGNDIGGSLRFPSFCCGLATVKPSLGRVPTFNPSASAERGPLAQIMSVQGAICREVRDVRAALRVMSKGDHRDPWWVPAPIDWPPQSTVKVAFTKQSYGYPIHAEIVAGLDRAADFLSDAGYEVVEVETPSILDPANGWFDVFVRELKETLGPVTKEHGSETIQRIFEYYESVGNMIELEDYLSALSQRCVFTRAWNVFLGEYPLVLCPFLMRPTFAWDYDAQGIDRTADLFQSAIYSVGVNYLSVPSGVVPIGYADSLPAGVQVIGRRYREDLILDALEAIEKRVGIMTHELWQRET
ncbi:MAG: amidase [Thiotrichales bacterium]|nr:amidase [Thiotrichales bacterium]